MVRLKVLGLGYKITVSSSNSERILCRVDPAGSFIKNDISGIISGLVNSYSKRPNDTEFRIYLVDSYDAFLDEFIIRNDLINLSIENRRLDWYDAEDSLGWGTISYIDLNDVNNPPALCIGLYLNRKNKDLELILSQLYTYLQTSSRSIIFTTSDPAIVPNHVSHFQPTEVGFLQKRQPIWFKDFNFQFS